jgi:hypothetical protein
MKKWVVGAFSFILINLKLSSSCRLLVVLALGVYCSSFVKDLICSPRPFAPPVTRLSKITSPLDFSSSHSCNQRWAAIIWSMGFLPPIPLTQFPSLSSSLVISIVLPRRLQLQHLLSRRKLLIPAQHRCTR